MGGKSKSSSSSTQSTTTRDERIAATDNAVVIKDASNINILDAGAISSNKEITLAVLEAAQESMQHTYEAAGTAVDKVMEFLKTANEKTTADTTGAQKLMPWAVVGVSVIALSYALKK